VSQTENIRIKTLLIIFIHRIYTTYFNNYYTYNKCILLRMCLDFLSLKMYTTSSDFITQRCYLFNGLF